MKNKIKQFKEFLAEQLDDYDEFGEVDRQFYIDDITDKAVELFAISATKCECKKEWLSHRREYDQHPYGDNIEYDECGKCGEKHNFHCF